MSMTNSSIKIAQMPERIGVEDTDLLIVEDSEDTKKSSVREFKKNLVGDYSDPNEYKFYSSIKIAKILQDIDRLLSEKATDADLKAIEKRLANIVASSGDDITEVVEARDGEDSLGVRLERDLDMIDETYIKKLSKVATGETIKLFDHVGHIKISAVSKQSTLGASVERTGSDVSYIVTGRNIINPEQSGIVSLKNSTLIISPDTTTRAFNATIDLAKIYPAGTYYVSCILRNAVDYNDSGFAIRYTDGSIDSIPYKFESTFKFTARKPFYAVMIMLTEDSIVASGGNKLTLSTFRITKDEDVDHYCKPYLATGGLNPANTIVDYNEEYEYTITNGSEYYDLRIEYYDYNFNAEYLYDSLLDLYNSINDKTEYCGLITDPGYRQYFTDAVVNSYPAGCTFEDAGNDMIRNGVVSKQLCIDKNTTLNPTFIQAIDEPVENIDTVALTFYIDRTVANEFTDRDGIRIHLSSDSLDTSKIVNYYTYVIKKSEMVQGWNVCKKKLSEFTSIGNPDPHSIKSVTIEIGRNDNLNGLGMYFNCITFNQKMKPTILLSFNGFYEESSLEYTYPYLTSRNIPATVFINSRNTLSNEVIDSLIKLRVKNDWDFGQYGCNPNKEYLQYDDNFRNQYISLRDTREWIRNNITDNVMSYCAPQGVLRPITVPILKDLGSKIGTAQGNGYCAEFTEKDYVLPMHLISRDTPVNDIKALIDYAVETNQCLPLYTNDVTQYGDEQSATKTIFETIINYIIELRDAGKIQCLTYKEFYKRCVEK